MLCENDDAIPRAHHHHTDPATAIAAAAAEATTGSVAAAAADAQVASGTSGAAASTAAAAAAQSGKQATEATAEFYPGAEFELIEAAPKQRFTRIVLRETCLMDHCKSRAVLYHTILCTILLGTLQYGAVLRCTASYLVIRSCTVL